MPTDKLLHLFAGIAIAAVVYPFGILWACFVGGAASVTPA